MSSDQHCARETQPNSGDVDRQSPPTWLFVNAQLQPVWQGAWASNPLSRLPTSWLTYLWEFLMCMHGKQARHTATTPIPQPMRAGQGLQRLHTKPSTPQALRRLRPAAGR